MIQIKNAYKSFKQTKVFEDMSLTIDKPGIYIIQGESGSGKSTLLNLLAGYEPFDKGSIDIDSNLAVIFQNYELLDSLTVKENIFFTNVEVSETELEIVEVLGLNELMNHRCNELSGGQRQRVGIARALLLNPNIILCDEPTESLDIDNKIIVMELLKKLSQTKIVIIASHDQKMIDDFAENIYKIENHNIVAYKVSDNTNSITSSCSKKIDKNRVSKLINKLLWKKSLLFSIIISLLILLAQGLYVFQKSLFYMANTTNTVNADMVYLTFWENQVDLDNYDIEKDELVPIPKFMNLYIDGQEMSTNVFPYIENSLALTGTKPKGNEILINQNVASIIKNYKEREVEFVYILDGERIVEKYTICGVVNELDTAAYNFYYDLDGFNNNLKSRYNYYGLNYYESFVNESKYYQLDFAYDKVAELYKRVREKEEFAIYNPLYEERLEFETNSAVYKWLFLAFEAIVIVSILLLILTYITTDINQYMSISSIMVSMLVPIYIAKQQYAKNKLMYFIPICLVSTFVGVVLFYTIYKFKYIEMNDYIVIIALALTMILVYVSVLIIQMRNFKKERINSILKDSKD